MKQHEFHGKYANMPLKDRLIPINAIKYGPTFTPTHLYQAIKELGDKMRPDVIEMDRLLRIAEEFL